MTHIVDSPLLVFALSLVALWVAALIGTFLRKSFRPLEATEQHDFERILAATLTLLGLIIGFGFSMAVSRYDQRKSLEAAEANAIGTEYVRADLLPPVEAARVRELLKDYLDQRVLFYKSADEHQLAGIDLRTSQLQTDLWSVVQTTAAKQSKLTVALAVSGMNDVLNAQTYTQAAWWNRLPVTAWCLVLAIAFFCSLLFGYTVQRRGRGVLLALPLVVSISLFLIADIDSPRHGLIRTVPQNLIRLSETLRSK
jgi:hypothetical protein